MNLRMSVICRLAGLYLRFHRGAIVFALCASLCPSLGQAQSIDWAVSAGGGLTDRGLDIAVDAAGNSYVTGTFEGTATFGSFTLASAGESALFVAKYDAGGNVLWARSADAADWAVRIAADASGNSYVAARFEGTASFGPFTLTSAGEEDAFVVKYDTDGNVLWARSGGGENNDHPRGIGVDAAGNSYMAGYFGGTATFGPFTLSSPIYHGVFVVKYDPGGTVLWARQSMGTWVDWSKGIAVDHAGNSYVIGGFEESTTFGTFTVTSAGDWDLFVVKYDTDGNVLWARSAGGIGRDVVNDIAVDAAGNSYITGLYAWIGWLTDTATFGPFTLTSAGDGDVFVAKFDPDGNVLWAQSAGGPGNDQGNRVAVYDSGISRVIGFYQGTATFGPFTLTATVLPSSFVAEYDSGGNVLWVDSPTQGGSAVTLDAAGNSYLTGCFEDTATFGPYTLTSAGDFDAFVARYHPGACCLPNSSCVENAPSDCDSTGGTYVGGACDHDVDGDAIDAACGDPCPNDNPDDSDGDGVCDSDDPCPNDHPDDTDGDGVCDSDDPCPLDPADDSDGDSVCDSDDACPGFDDGADADSDAMPDDCDECPYDPAKTVPGVCGCGVPDEGNADGDGALDCVDQCPGVDDAVFGPHCVAAIPAVSTWGLIALALLLLTSAKLVFTVKQRAREAKSS